MSNARELRALCYALSRADTFTPVTAWMEMRIDELEEWVHVVADHLEAQSKKAKQARR